MCTVLLGELMHAVSCWTMIDFAQHYPHIPVKYGIVRLTFSLMMGDVCNAFLVTTIFLFAVV